MKNAILLFVSIAIALILMEIIVRALHPQPPALVVASNDYRLIYELNPLYPQINSQGMRGAELDPALLRDHFIIAFIGDSHTYSLRQTKWEDSLPARLEFHLKAMSGMNVSVLNFGVPGYNMAQELEVLRAKALAFSPDIVILQYCINDDHISNYIQPKYPWFNRLISHSFLITHAWGTLLYSEFGRKHLLPFVESKLPDLLLFTPGLVGTVTARESDPLHQHHPPRSKSQVPPRYHDFIGRENLERDTRIFGETLKAAGIPGLATGFIGPDDLNRYLSAGFQVYSFDEIFKGLNMIDYGYDPARTSQHFSDSGSDFIGEALARHISSDPTFGLQSHGAR